MKVLISEAPTSAGWSRFHRGETYALKVYELRDKVPLTEAELEWWQHEHRYSLEFRKADPPTTRPVANGRLALAIEHSYGSGRRSNWREGPRGPLEAKLPAFFAELEARAEVDEQESKRRAIDREQRERELEAQRERQRLAQIDQARGEQFSAEAKLWRELQDSRDYISALKARLERLEPGERERIAAWVDWAEGWIEKSDPAINTGRIRGLEEPSVPDARFGARLRPHD